MNEFKRAREEYESTPIPEELDARVRAGIRQGRTSSRSRGYKVVRRTAGSVAACLAVLMAGLNVSPTFAAAAADVPVLGGLFQVLTIRDYETVENGIDYKVTVPGVESEGDLAEKVNAEIQERVTPIWPRLRRTGMITRMHSWLPAAPRKSGPTGR